MTTMCKLDIGCGRSPQPGYTGVDIEPCVGPAITAPMWAIPLPSGCVEAIFSTHALEHVGKNDVIPTLREWARLLAPSGTIELRVPDLKWCVTNWIDKGCPNDWNLDTIFGNQEHAGEFHRTGFTPELMAHYASHAGLIIRQQSTIQSHGQPTLVFIMGKA